MKFYRNPIFIYTFVAVIALVCAIILYLFFGETAPPGPSPNMDKLLVDILSSEKIDLASVQRTKKSDGIIYYQIPIHDENLITSLDTAIYDTLSQSGFTISDIIKTEKYEQTKVYLDSHTKQKYTIEIYNPENRLTQQASSTKPQICIVVDDFGNFDGPLVDAFCDLDPEITFAILPGQPFTKSVMQKAVQRNHEVIVHMPWQPESDSTNPGSNAILSTMSPRVIYDNVKAFFTEISAAKGANQHMGSLISADKTLMTAALRYLADQNYFFIDSRTTADTYGQEVASELGIPFEKRSINFLDSPENSDAILRERIANLKEHLDTDKRALVITHCHDRARLERLKTFIAEAKKMGFEIVPASKYVKKLNHNVVG